MIDRKNFKPVLYPKGTEGMYVVYSVRQIRSIAYGEGKVHVFFGAKRDDRIERMVLCPANKRTADRHVDELNRYNPDNPHVAMTITEYMSVETQARSILCGETPRTLEPFAPTDS